MPAAWLVLSCRPALFSFGVGGRRHVSFDTVACSSSVPSRCARARSRILEDSRADPRACRWLEHARNPQISSSLPLSPSPLGFARYGARRLRGATAWRLLAGCSAGPAWQVLACMHAMLNSAPPLEWTVARGKSYFLRFFLKKMNRSPVRSVLNE